MALCTLISSILVYNTTGALEESSIESVAVLVEGIASIASRNLKLKGHSILQEFPAFLWVLRDFSLDLGIESSADYLENCLKDLKVTDVSNKQELQTKQIQNQMRNQIKKTFKRRSCFTLPRPTQAEKDLKNLHQLTEEQLRPQFESDLKRFLQYMSLNVAPKTLNSNYMTGNVLCGLLSELVIVFNSGETPFLHSITDTLFEKEAQEILKLYLQKVEDYSKEMLNTLPRDELSLHKNYQIFLMDTRKEFTEQSAHLCSKEIFVQNENTLMNLLIDKLTVLETSNKASTSVESDRVLQRFISEYKVPNVSNREAFTRNMIQDMKKVFEEWLKSYVKSKIGPGANGNCVLTVPPFIFECFDTLYQRLLNILDDTYTEIESDAQLKKNSSLQMKEYLRLQEDTVTDLKKENQRLVQEIEKMNRENDRTVKQGVKKSEDKIVRITSLEAALTKKNSQFEIMDKKVKELQTDLNEALEKLNNKQLKIEKLNQSLINIETTKQGDAIQNFSGNPGTTPQVYEMIKYLNQHVENLQSEVRSRGQQTIQKLKDRLASKEREVEVLLEEKESFTKEIKDQHFKKLREIKQIYETRIKELEIQQRKDYLKQKELKNELFEKKRLEQELKKLAMLNSEAKQRISGLEELKTTIESKGNINQETFIKFIKQIEAKNIEKNQSEEKLVIFKKQALQVESEVGNIMNCVNNIATRSRDKSLIVHAIKKLSKDSIMKLKPFFSAYKIKV